ncbi:MAG: response regulator [Ignavibacteriae bacterium]|nr:response regulator [Ignavibacteriota bacterium]
MNKPYSILVVDDSPHMRILISRLLKNRGFEKVESAENGLRGLEKFKTLDPEVVFLDGIMPEMDGLTVLREIKKIDPETIVVITTSLSDREKVLEFKTAGANHYLLKPFEDNKFDETLQKVVATLEQRTAKG